MFHGKVIMESKLNIVAISNEDWLFTHGLRWARFARRSNPDAKLLLLYAGNMVKNDVTDMFDHVFYFPNASANRDWYNTIRMEAGKWCGIDEYLYCDLDADILQDMSHVKNQPGDVMWVRSPSVSEEWKRLCKKNGWQEWGANNGLLYVRKDYSQRYKEILGTLKAEGCSQRLVGTYAFNQLVRENKESFSELPYFNSVIWWDYQNIAIAKVLQYCNDQGQTKRLMLEQSWRDAL